MMAADAPGRALLRIFVISAMARTRLAGDPVAGTQTGMTPTLLPSWVAVACLRADTGTEITNSSTRSPRAASTPRKAPVTAASTASLTVAP